MNEAKNDLHEIRRMMEKSSRFLSLSGLSGVAAGCVALTGAVVVHQHLLQSVNDDKLPYFYNHLSFYSFYIVITLLVLIFAVFGALFFSYRKATKNNEKLWSKNARTLLQSLLVPLIIGGFFCLILLHHGYVGLIPPSMLVFYGLALIYAKQHTLGDIGSLGYLQVLLGLLNLIWLGRGIYFWAAGFGVAHIAYGIYMYVKYDLKK